MKTFMHEHIPKLPERLNEILRDSYVKEVEEYNRSMQKVLREGFGMDGEEVFVFLNTSESNVHQSCCSELKSIFNNLVNQYLLRKFALGFKRDDQGNNRNWKEIEEPQIKELFDVNKKKAEDSIEGFKLIGFPKHITKTEEDSMEEEFVDHSRQTSKFEANDHLETKTPEDMNFKRKLSSVHFKVITEEEVTKVRDKFYEDIDFAYEEAIARHRSSSTGDVPWWIWVLMAWFASDNIMGWIQSPIIFYPMLMLSAFAIVLH